MTESTIYTPTLKRHSRDPDDGPINYYVNGERVGTVNHDEHGRAGMEAVSDMFDRLAEVLGVEIEDVEGEDDGQEGEDD